MKKKEFIKQNLEFDRKVRKTFAFLVEEYGFVYFGTKKYNFQYPMDAFITVEFIKKDLAIRVVWQLGEASMGVDLIALENGQIPDRVSFYDDEGYVMAVSLDSLIEVITEGEVLSPLPEFSGQLSIAEMYRRAETRKILMETRFDFILETYARRLKKYGSDILKGDLDIFRKVVEYHQKKWSDDE